LGNVEDSRQGEPGNGGASGEDDEGSGDKRMEEAFAFNWQAGLLFQEAEASGVCGRLLLARVPDVFSPAQTEPSILEG